MATILFATDKDVSKYLVFMASTSVLIVATAIGVLADAVFSQYIYEKYLHYLAGLGFIAIGIYTLYKA